MAASPRWKVYDAHGEYQASCFEIEAAAALMVFYGDGATIRDGHPKKYAVWTEGREEVHAAESYDRVAEIVWQRDAERLAKLRVESPYLLAQQTGERP